MQRPAGCVGGAQALEGTGNRLRHVAIERPTHRALIGAIRRAPTALSRHAVLNRPRAGCVVSASVRGRRTEPRQLAGEPLHRWPSRPGRWVTRCAHPVGV
jgi:hypothetical protein